ncbi:unnamed protein product [Dicrocoelium dendriticum]|nr:unnamed protein product [Dicrocoelium dendriticum]
MNLPKCRCVLISTMFVTQVNLCTIVGLYKSKKNINVVVFPPLTYWYGGSGWHRLMLHHISVAACSEGTLAGPTTTTSEFDEEYPCETFSSIPFFISWSLLMLHV